jgi:selenocysteine lyase/cysteine desulfurase
LSGTALTAARVTPRLSLAFRECFFDNGSVSPVQDPPLLGSCRELFDVPEDVAYYNVANLAPHLHAVRRAGDEALDRRGRPWAIQPADWFSDVERLRHLFARVIGADAEGIALIPATSYGFAVAARNLSIEAGERIVVLADEYPSGIYTWQQLARSTGAELFTVTRDPSQTWTEALLDCLDERASIVSVPQVHWTDGALVELDTIAARAHELGASLVIDASQSAGAMPLDVASLRPDFVITVGYKWLLGPFGLGYLYAAEHHRHGEPIEHNWILRAGSEDFARLVDYRDELQPGARRYDVGERTNFELTPMAVAALEQILDWSVPRIASTLRALTTRVAARARELDLAPLPDDQRGPHLLGISLPEAARSRTLDALAETGCYAAIRGGSLRIAPHLHITDNDIESLAGGLRAATGSAT